MGPGATRLTVSPLTYSSSRNHCLKAGNSPVQSGAVSTCGESLRTQHRVRIDHHDRGTLIPARNSKALFDFALQIAGLYHRCGSPTSFAVEHDESVTILAVELSQELVGPQRAARVFVGMDVKIERNVVESEAAHGDKRPSTAHFICSSATSNTRSFSNDAAVIPARLRQREPRGFLASPVPQFGMPIAGNDVCGSFLRFRKTKHLLGFHYAQNHGEWVAKRICASYTDNSDWCIASTARGWMPFSGSSIR